MKTNQDHRGRGDNIAGNKYELHISGVQPLPRLLTRLPRPEDRFIGRKRELAKLEKALAQNQSVLLLNGMGGIGKTALAMAFANQHLERYEHLAWIEQLDDFTGSLTANPLLLDNLGFEPSGEPEQDAQLLLNRLANLEGPGLLIIDNADEELNAYRDYLPGPPHWQVLVTSRERLPLPETIELGFLPEDEALDLFFDHYKRDDDQDSARRILETIDYHTLTLEVLAKTAQRRRIRPLSRLHELLRERGLTIGRKAGIRVGHSRYEKIERLFPYLLTVFEWSEASPKEEWLLRQWIALPPTFVPFDTLCNLFQLSEEEEEEDWDDFTTALDSLQDKGWLSYDTEQEAYKMHRIVQEVIQHRFPPKAEDYLLLIKRTAELMDYDNTDPDSDLFEKIGWMPFGEHMAELFQQEEQEDIIKLLGELGYLHENLGQYAIAVELKERALAIATALFTPDHPSVAVSQSNLATVYRNMGRYGEAAELLEKALESALANFGDKHPSVAVRQSNLANVYSDMGRYGEAAELLEKALESDLANFGDKHPSVAVSQSNLAWVYWEQEKKKAALDLWSQAHRVFLEAFGPEHPHTKTVNGFLEKYG